jgi:hypothetical protein
MIYCDKAFGPDGFAIVKATEEEWIVVTVAVKTHWAQGTRGPLAVPLQEVLENCGTAALQNAYRRRPSKIERGRLPIQFDDPLPAFEEASEVVEELLADHRVRGFLRLQVTFPHAGEPLRNVKGLSKLCGVFLARLRLVLFWI